MRALSLTFSLPLSLSLSLSLSRSLSRSLSHSLSHSLSLSLSLARSLVRSLSLSYSLPMLVVAQSPVSALRERGGRTVEGDGSYKKIPSGFVCLVTVCVRKKRLEQTPEGRELVQTSSRGSGP